MDLVDIHCHILWGIDDGPEDLAGSLAMARAASASGVTTIVATPHLRPDFPKVKVDEVADRVEALRRAAAEAGIAVGLEPGGEVGLSWAMEADDRQLRLASYGQRGTDLLIETPLFNGTVVSRLLGEISSRGYRVTLAHPERLMDFQRDPGLLRALVEQGVILQVNADAVLANARRSAAARLAQYLCVHRLASAVASDGHRAENWRPLTRLSEAREPLLKLVGAEGAERALSVVPAQIVAGAALELPPPLPEPKSRFGRRRGAGT